MNTHQIGNRILILCDKEELGRSISQQLGVGREAISCTPLSIGREDACRLAAAR